MFPQWLTKDADFKRIFKTKFLPEDVGIRKDPDQRTDKNLGYGSVVQYPYPI